MYLEATDLLRSGGDARALAEQLVAEMSDDEKISCLDGGVPFWAGLMDLASYGYHYRPFPGAIVPRLQIPGFFFSDGPRGVVVNHATCFPVAMARGATWDVDLEEEIGDVIGKEIRAVGATLYGGVCVNLLRHPAWGRAQETFGEDPFHVGEMGAALTRGVQRHAMAVVKHFACNSIENTRFQVDVNVDEVSLHEVFLPHFKRIVDEGIAVVMSAYNQVNGQWCGDSPALLSEVLRDEWGFDGFVISDWIYGMRDTADSIHAGLNVEMPYRMMRHVNIRAALESGDVTMDDVETCILPTITTMLRFHDLLERSTQPASILQSPAHRALARRTSARSMVLLRNEQINGTPLLPLTLDKVTSVGLFGPLASAVNLGDGGSSDVWADNVVTPEKGLAALLGTRTLELVAGDDLDGAERMARQVDVAIVVVGTTCLEEGEYLDIAATAHLAPLMPGPDEPGSGEAFASFIEANPAVEAPEWISNRDTSGFTPGGDRSTLRLSEHEVALIKRVAGANPATVVVLQGGSAFLISEWDQIPGAILHSWYSGVEGGAALADVLFGIEEPGGRLPFSIPVKEDDLPDFFASAETAVYGRYHGWWHLENKATPAAYPFGFGLSYTTFEIGSPTVVSSGTSIEIDVPVKNTGDRDGRALVQLFGQRDQSNGPRRLIGFARVPLAPGESTTLRLNVDPAALSERDVAVHAMVVIPGSYSLWAAAHAGEERVPIRFEITSSH